jgi:hypothetical protein
MSKKEFAPDDIVKALRTATNTVSTPYGECGQGDVIPMRFEEADGRDDFEVIGKWAGAAETTVNEIAAAAPVAEAEGQAADNEKKEK